MEDQLAFGISLGLGLGPAVAVLWHSLRSFDYPRVEKTLFDDRRVFLSLGVGLVFGTLSSFLSLGFRGLDLATDVIVLFAFAVLEASFLLAYLNRRGYRQRFDTTFYGVPLGVGLAATLVLASGLVNASTLLSPATFVLLLVFSLSLSLIEGSVGALIGFGCAKGIPWPYFLRALGARAAYIVLALTFFVEGTDVALRILSLFMALLAALLVYWYVYVFILPETLPGELRRLRRKAARRVPKESG